MDVMLRNKVIDLNWMLVVIESNVFIIRVAAAQSITYHDNKFEYTAATMFVSAFVASYANKMSYTNSGI